MNLSGSLCSGWGMETINLGHWLAHASRSLSSISEQPRLEAEVLAAHGLQSSRAAVLAHPEKALDLETLRRLEQSLSSLVAGEPLPYILGEWEFFGRKFILSPAVLIPRPETELLVEQALFWVNKNPDKALRIADVGTGSGCIAISLALELTRSTVLASDLSISALLVAKENIHRYGLEERLWLVRADLLAGFRGSFDLICANLPYIPTGRLARLAVADHEPIIALDGGEDGLAYIERLLRQSPYLLAKGGLLLIELDDSHAEKAAQLARHQFTHARIDILLDGQQQARVLRIENAVQ